jgi:hypothetical protein
MILAMHLFLTVIAVADAPCVRGVSRVPRSCIRCPCVKPRSCVRYPCVLHSHILNRRVLISLIGDPHVRPCVRLDGHVFKPDVLCTHIGYVCTRIEVACIWLAFNVRAAGILCFPRVPTVLEPSVFRQGNVAVVGGAGFHADVVTADEAILTVRSPLAFPRGYGTPAAGEGK